MIAATARPVRGVDDDTERSAIKNQTPKPSELSLVTVMIFRSPMNQLLMPLIVGTIRKERELGMNTDLGGPRDGSGLPSPL